MINDSLWNDIKAYCDTNNIEDVDDLVNKMLMRGFSIEKFGETPKTPSKPPKVIEKVVEKIVEKPVEVIKEVEVEVEKIIKVSDDAKLEELLEEMNQKEVEYKEVLDTFKKDRTEQAEHVSKLKGEIDELKKNYETQIAELEEKLRNCAKRDIYGE